LAGKLLESGAHRLGRGRSGGSSDSNGFGDAPAVRRGQEARGWGCSRRAPCKEKGARGENFGTAVTDAF
jgi:hypothetical protein